MVATAVTLDDLEGHSPLAVVFKCNSSNICAAFYTISTDSVLAWFLCISRASCLIYFTRASGDWRTSPLVNTNLITVTLLILTLIRVD